MLLPPFEEILRNVSPLAPIVVLATSSAVPVVEEIVLTMVVLFCVALTVPPPIELNPLPLVVVMLNPPVKLVVEPAFPLGILMAFAVVVFAVIPPVKAAVPPVLLFIETAFVAFVCRMVPA